VIEGWRLLQDADALVLEPGANAIRIANPFSAVPTSYRVLAQGHWWFPHTQAPEGRLADWTEYEYSCRSQSRVALPG
jgi:hypothetical protein